MFNLLNLISPTFLADHNSFLSKMIAFTASFGLLIVSSVFRTTLASALPAATPEKRGSEIFSSQFLGDRGHPGVYATQLNDMSLATAGGRSRRPTKFKIWCDENTGPLSMMPWYNDHDGEDGEAKHWTWGYNPPRGTHKELIVKYESEYIDRVTYGVCGPRGNQRICYLFMRKTNKLTNDQGSVTCGDQNGALELKSFAIKRLLTICSAIQPCHRHERSRRNHWGQSVFGVRWNVYCDWYYRDSDTMGRPCVLLAEIMIVSAG